MRSKRLVILALLIRGNMGVEKTPPTETESAEGLARLLEIGRLLSSVLSPEEVENLHMLLRRRGSCDVTFFSLTSEMEIGNTSVT
jgi:hypothetical protein